VSGPKYEKPRGSGSLSELPRNLLSHVKLNEGVIPERAEIDGEYLLRYCPFA
jgi:hypothetical protein